MSLMRTKLRLIYAVFKIEWVGGNMMVVQMSIVDLRMIYPFVA